MSDPHRLPPFTDRRRLPSVFPGTVPLPPSIKEWVARMSQHHGDDPADVLEDLLELAADELEGAVMDERELGFATSPWSDQPTGEPKPEPPAAPEPRGPHPAEPSAPPAGSPGAAP